MANPGNPKPLAAILLALVLTALCLATDENESSNRASQYGRAVFSPASETFANVEP